MLKGSAILPLPTFSSFPSRAILLALLPHHAPCRHFCARPTRPRTRPRIHAGPYLLAISNGRLLYNLIFFFNMKAVLFFVVMKLAFVHLYWSSKT
uniref:Uncharacterized protein n=1 Tax=Ixodes ricinus TaxID=34613 RepID=A0A6B0UCZ0_IXORI